LLARENAFGEREENACAPSVQGEREENACAPSVQGEREEFSRAESLDEKKRISSLSPKAKRPPSHLFSSPSAMRREEAVCARLRREELGASLLFRLACVSLAFGEEMRSAERLGA